MDFKYSEMFPLGKDRSEYRLVTKDYVKVSNFKGEEVLEVEQEGLRILAKEAFHDVSFFLRPDHNEQVAKILSDPEAGKNDKAVALTMLLNADISAKEVLPFCQDTGTAIVVAKKGHQIWTNGQDQESLSHGIFDTYTTDNLRYSQTIALDMYTEKNSGNNLPAQIDIYAEKGLEYKFLFIAKGGGSANKTYLFQETKALLNPQSLEKFLVEKFIDFIAVKEL